MMGRSAGKLAQAKAALPAIDTIACDTSDEAGVKRALDQLTKQRPSFNMLVNAAGLSSACQFATDERAIAIARAEINTNLLGTVIVTKLALDRLLQQTTPAAIVTISSGIALAAHRSEPTHSATKAYTTKKASPEAVARAVVQGIAKNRHEIRIGIVKALGFLVRVSPSLASRVVTSSGQIEP